MEVTNDAVNNSGDTYKPNERRKLRGIDGEVDCLCEMSAAENSIYWFTEYVTVIKSTAELSGVFIRKDGTVNQREISARRAMGLSLVALSECVLSPLMYSSCYENFGKHVWQ